jgi:hypothetical protein
MQKELRGRNLSTLGEIDHIEHAACLEAEENYLNIPRRGNF